MLALRTSPGTATRGRPARVLRPASMDRAGEARVRQRHPRESGPAGRRQVGESPSTLFAWSLRQRSRGLSSLTGTVARALRRCRSMRFAVAGRFLTGSSAMVPPRPRAYARRPRSRVTIRRRRKLSAQVCRRSTFVQRVQTVSSLGLPSFRPTSLSSEASSASMMR